MTGSQTDLVAVGAVTGGSGGDDLALGQLAGQGLGSRGEGIARTGETHGLVYIAASRQRVTDGAAQTGSSTAEGFDLGGVVMCLILEHEQPVLSLAVVIHGDLHRAGVDLLALVQVGEDARPAQFLGADGGKIHQGHRLVLAGMDSLAQFQIVLVFLGNVVTADLHIVDLGGKGGMPAVIRPVGVDHLHFGDGGVTVLGIPEVGLTAECVVQIHGKALGTDKLLQTGPVQSGKALYRSNSLRHSIAGLQGLRHLQRSLPGFHRVDQIGLDPLEFLIGDVALQYIDPGILHGGTLTQGGELDALGAGIGPLVELTGQVLNGKDLAVTGRELVIDHIHRGLGEDGIPHRIEYLPADALHIIPVQQPDMAELRKPEIVPERRQNPGSLHGKGFLLLHIDPVNRHIAQLLKPLPPESGVFCFALFFLFYIVNPCPVREKRLCYPAKTPVQPSGPASVIRTGRSSPRRSSAQRTRTGV